MNGYGAIYVFGHQRGGERDGHLLCRLLAMPCTYRGIPSSEAIGEHLGREVGVIGPSGLHQMKLALEYCIIPY